MRPASARLSMRDRSALTPAEQSFMAEFCANADLGAASQRLGVTRKTAENRLRTVMDKLGARDRFEAIETFSKETRS